MKHARSILFSVVIVFAHLQNNMSKADLPLCLRIDSVPNSHRRPNCPQQGSRGVMIIVSQPLPSEVNQTVQQLAVQALHAGFTPLQGDVQGAGEAATGGGGPANPGFHGGAEPPPGGPEREGVRSFLDPSMGRMGIGWRNRMGRGLSSPPPLPLPAF